MYSSYKADIHYYNPSIQSSVINSCSHFHFGDKQTCVCTFSITTSTLSLKLKVLTGYW